MNESKTISPPQEKKIVGSSNPPQKLDQNKRELIILRGITTSQVNQALKAKSPYPARVFLKVEGQEQRSLNGFNKPLEDIPVFFRIKYEKDSCQFHYGCPWCCDNEKESWIKPKIKTGSTIEVKGYFDNPKNGSSRKSFTATSFQLLPAEKERIKSSHFQEQVQEFGGEIMTKQQELEKIRNNGQ
ncbi:MAG: hypothetical protein I3273_03790 [Candidatus Moeniiplasma glomeromycotorum]|nr:hypothetical protein [Candidatus Moeniiplasma glomeromycotorum]MCE8169218.1 hypothetical protein [Candidatus Moeniiplasma glomeromycotorum]